MSSENKNFLRNGHVYDYVCDADSLFHCLNYSIIQDRFCFMAIMESIEE